MNKIKNQNNPSIEKIEYGNDFSNLDFSNLDLSSMDLSGKLFESCNFNNTKFYNSNVHAAGFINCSIDFAKFNKCVGIPLIKNCTKEGALIERFVFVADPTNWGAGFKCIKNKEIIYYLTDLNGYERKFKQPTKGIERALVQLLNDM